MLAIFIYILLRFKRIEFKMRMKVNIIFLFFVAPHDALFVVGSLDEAVLIKGLRYHPVDIETSVIRCHKGISEWYVITAFHHHKLFSVFSAIDPGRILFAFLPACQGKFYNT